MKAEWCAVCIRKEEHTQNTRHTRGRVDELEKSNRIIEQSAHSSEVHNQDHLSSAHSFA